MKCSSGFPPVMIVVLVHMSDVTSQLNDKAWYSFFHSFLVNTLVQMLYTDFTPVGCRQYKHR